MKPSPLSLSSHVVAKRNARKKYRFKLGTFVSIMNCLKQIADIFLMKRAISDQLNPLGDKATNSKYPMICSKSLLD